LEVKKATKMMSIERRRLPLPLLLHPVNHM
jgi:hypothetical protein